MASLDAASSGDSGTLYLALQVEVRGAGRSHLFALIIPFDVVVGTKYMIKL